MNNNISINITIVLIIITLFLSLLKILRIISCSWYVVFATLLVPTIIVVMCIAIYNMFG